MNIDPIASLRRDVASFLDAARPLVLSVRVAADLVEAAARIVASVDTSGGRPAAAFPHPCRGVTAADYFEAWAESILASCEQSAQDFMEERERNDDLPGDLLPAMPALPHYDRSLEPAAAFAAFVERLAERVQRLASVVVVVTYADDELPPDIRAALSRFARMLGSARVKLIVLDASSKPLLPQGTLPFPRVTRGGPWRSFAVGVEARLMIAPSPDPGGQAQRIRTVLIPYEGRERFEAALFDALDIDRPVDGESSFDFLAAGLEALQEQHGAEPLVVAVDLRPSQTPELLATWIEQCAAALASPRTKLVIIEDPSAPVAPHLRAVEMPFATTSFAMKTADVTAALSRSAADETAPSAERFSALVGLAGHASGHGETQRALELLVRAARLAASSSDHATLALHEGHTHYRAADFPRARAAYDRGVVLLTQDEEPYASSGLLAQLLVGLAHAQLRLGKFQNAAEIYECASGVFGHSGAIVHTIPTDAWRGEAHRRAGEMDRAGEIWAEASARAESLGPDLVEVSAPLKAELFERRARLLEQQSRHREAASLREQGRRSGPPPHVPPEP